MLTLSMICSHGSYLCMLQYKIMANQPPPRTPQHTLDFFIKQLLSFVPNLFIVFLLFKFQQKDNKNIFIWESMTYIDGSSAFGHISSSLGIPIMKTVRSDGCQCCILSLSLRPTHSYYSMTYWRN